jgi:aspartate kinase
LNIQNKKISAKGTKPEYYGKYYFCRLKDIRMIVHKFGGASIKDAESIRNLESIVRNRIEPNAVLVLSAMGKTTNMLEEVTSLAYAENPKWAVKLNDVTKYHTEVCNLLYGNSKHSPEDEVKTLFSELSIKIHQTLKLSYNKFYDAVVSTGELASTLIVERYLLHCGIKVIPLKATEIIITDNTYREGKINWEETTDRISTTIKEDNGIYITQGFIAGTTDGDVTTLGREGSDFSAAVIGNILKSKEVRIWKDVDGLYSADPKLFNDAVLLPRVSYRECVELGYYGARVIHPRTILPLRRHAIPLYIQSFKNPDNPGTLICSHNTEPVKIPCLILKNKQCLMTITPKDLGFMAEEYVEIIIAEIKAVGVRINLLQSSAVNLTVCFDFDEYRFKPMIRRLENTFELRYNNGLSLLTISNYTPQCVNEHMENKDILLTQQSRKIIRFVYQ